MDLLLWKCNCGSTVSDVSARQLLTAFGRAPASSASAFPYHSVPTIPHGLQLPTPLNLGHLVLKFCVWLAWVWVFDLLSQALVFTDVNFLSLQCAVLSKVSPFLHISR